MPDAPSSQNNYVESLPLRFAEPIDFVRTVSLFKTAGFEEANLQRLLKIEALHDLDNINPKAVNFGAAEAELLPVLIKLFLFSENVPRAAVERVIEADSLQALLNLDLLRTGNFSPRQDQTVYYSPVFLYPVAGLLIASDRRSNPDGSEFELPSTFVFPAIHSGTSHFLQTIPALEVEEALDLCTGTGVAALKLSQSAKRLVATDISKRCIHFARFNARLNQCENVEIVQSDLFFGLGERAFDLIVTHPPYIPSLLKAMVYRDAGDTGEMLVRRIIEETPRRLKPGGTLYCICAGLDTTEGAFEQRARGWLGASEQSFDILFGVGTQADTSQYASELIKDQKDAPLIASRLQESFTQAGARNMVYGALVIHRRGEANANRPLTKRVQLSRLTDGDCFEWALRWHQWRARHEADGNLVEAVSRLNPRLSETLQVRVTYTLQKGTLAPSSVLLEAGKPFLSMMETPLWVVPVIGWFNNRRTPGEVYQRNLEASALPDGLTYEAFAKMVADLLEDGYLEDAAFGKRGWNR